MNATGGYPGTNINPEGHTPMSTTATTTRRTLYVGNLALDDTTPCLMPGDVIHIEATLTVRSVENGLDHFDRPAETITTRSDVKDGPQVAVRTSTLKAAGGNPLTTTAPRNALGPGTTLTRAPASATASTRTWPGSERPGIPASLTSAGALSSPLPSEAGHRRVTTNKYSPA